MTIEEQHRLPKRGQSTWRNKKTKITDERVSVCNICMKGIFSFHEYLWTGRGLVHTECHKREDEAKDKSIA